MVLSPFLFTLAFSIISCLFPSPTFPSQTPQILQLSSIWIIAYADDLAIVCASSVRLSRCLATLSRTLKRFWLAISAVKTEVVHFATRLNPHRPPLPVHLGSVTLPSSPMFKYLGIIVGSSGSLGLHQAAVVVKSMVAAREVGALFRNLEILRLYGDPTHSTTLWQPHSVCSTCATFPECVSKDPVRTFFFQWQLYKTFLRHRIDGLEGCDMHRG